MTLGRDIWAVVPVKELAHAKTRLAPQLSPAVRETLARAMVEDVIDALAQVRGLAGLIVVTVDPRVAALAARRGATIHGERATEGHTGAVMSAAQRLQAEGRDGMLTVPGDIPALRASEIEALLERHRAAPAFTIVPARDGRGSNAIVMSPPAAVRLAFGNDSFLPHLAAARQAGIEPTIVTGLDGIAHDVDSYEDAVALLALGRGGQARTALLAQMPVASSGVDHRGSDPRADGR